jgi:hypothetical protein
LARLGAASAEYARMAEKRIREDAGNLFREAVTVEKDRQLGMFDEAPR